MRKVLIGAALCAASMGAAAQATFNFTFNGTGFYTPCPQQQCGGTVPFAFTGTALIETTSFADGTYTGGDLIQMRWDSSFAGRFDIHDPSLTFNPFNVNSATVLDGKIVALSGSGTQGQPGMSTDKGFSQDMKVFVSGSWGQGTGINAEAQLVAIPEPSAWALMAGGLTLLGFARRRHGVKLVRVR